MWYLLIIPSPDRLLQILKMWFDLIDCWNDFTWRLPLNPGEQYTAFRMVRQIWLINNSNNDNKLIVNI